MDYLHTTKAELGINLDIPLSEQDPLEKLNDLANKKRKHADDIHDYFKVNKRLKSSVQYEDHLPGTVLKQTCPCLCNSRETEEGLWKELQFSLVDNSKLNVFKFKGDKTPNCHSTTLLFRKQAFAGHQVPPEALAAHTAWVKGQKEVAVLMLMTMEPDLQQNLENLGAYDML
ncbi:hypothetical protein Tco_0248132 [Tanacetum coccineum]